MRQNATEVCALAKSKKREQAAQLLADDKLIDEEIAARIGIDRATLARWKNQPDFAKRVEEITAAHAEITLRFGLARKERRLQVLNEAHDKILRVIEERSADPELRAVPGGSTGIIVKNLRGIGHGDDFKVVAVYRIDVTAIRELRATQAQAVKELGTPLARRGGPMTIAQATVNLTAKSQNQQSRATVQQQNQERLVERLREFYGLEPRPPRS